MKIIFLIALTIKMSICCEDRRVITTLKYSKYYVKPFVVNGLPAGQGEVPYLVSFKEPNKSLGPGRRIWMNLCGGTIISDLKVLTAAHCFELNSYFYFKYPNLLRVVAGNLRTDLVHSGRTETTEEGQWRSIAKLVLHHEFLFPLNDIALVFVNVPWEFTNKVNYILPASRTTDYEMNKCYSSGYGAIDYRFIKDSSSKVLLKARIDIMPRWKCTYVWQVNMDNFICSQSVVTDVGTGDSGGPLVCSGTSDPKEEVGREILVGVVSGKNFDATTIFTRVSQYKEWIETDNGFKLKISCYLLAITLLVIIYLLFHWFSLIVLVMKVRSKEILIPLA